MHKCFFEMIVPEVSYLNFSFFLYYKPIKALKSKGFRSHPILFLKAATAWSIMPPFCPARKRVQAFPKPPQPPWIMRKNEQTPFPPTPRLAGSNTARRSPSRIKFFCFRFHCVSPPKNKISAAPFQVSRDTF